MSMGKTMRIYRMTQEHNDRKAVRDMPMYRENEPVDRYRGDDGRWKPGRRRADGGYYDDEREMTHDREYEVKVKPSNVIDWPYTPDHPTNRRIGFGAMNNMDEHTHSEPERMGYAEAEPVEFNREIAEHWVRNMRNEDKAHPVGGKWTPEMIKPLAQKYGIPTEGRKFWELYAMTNAMYSDYSEVARKFGIVSPEFYVCMAKAWMQDEDAEPDKTALYYEYIVKK